MNLILKYNRFRKEQGLLPEFRFRDSELVYFQK
jgi:hypothetical protein